MNMARTFAAASRKRADVDAATAGAADAAAGFGHGLGIVFGQLRAASAPRFCSAVVIDVPQVR